MGQMETKRKRAGEITNILTLIAILIIGERIGSRGVTYVALAVEVYALLWGVSGASLSDTLGRLLRSRRNKGQYRNIRTMRGSVMACQAVLGLAGAILLCCSARGIAGNVFGIPYSALILMALSPLVFFRSVSAVLAGYFQGEGAELPGTVAGVLRVALLSGFSVLFLRLLGDYGEKASRLLREENFKPMYSGMGVALALSLSELFIVIFLTVVYKGSRRSEKAMRQEGMYSSETFFDCVRCFYAGRWPQAAVYVFGCLSLALGLFFFAQQEDMDVMTAQYGIYAGIYLAVCGIAVCLISLLALPAMARVLLCLRNGEPRLARKIFQGGVHMCLVHGIFLAVFAAVMGEQFIVLACPGGGETAVKMLAGGSSAILLLALSAYFCRFLQAAGKRGLVLESVGIAVAVFAISAGAVFNVRRVGALSPVYSGVAGLFVLCVLSGVFAYRLLQMHIDWLQVLIVPLGAGGAAALVCLPVRGAAAALGSLPALAAAFALAGAVYWGLLLLFRNFNEQELEVIPGGGLLNRLGQMLGAGRR